MKNIIFITNLFFLAAFAVQIRNLDEKGAPRILDSRGRCFRGSGPLRHGGGNRERNSWKGRNKMRFRIALCTVLIVAAVMLCSSFPVSSAARGSNSPTPPASFILDDTLNVKSDGLGLYLNGIGGVSSTVPGGWGFYLNANSRKDTSTPRSYWLDLSQPVDELNNNPYYGDKLKPFSFVANPIQCTAATNGQIVVADITSMPVGTTAYRQAWVRLQHYSQAGVDYLADILFGYHGNMAPNDPTPGLAVTRLSNNQWLVQALPNVPYGDVGRLNYVKNQKGAWQLIQQAYYHIPMSITLTLTQ